MIHIFKIMYHGLSLLWWQAFHPTLKCGWNSYRYRFPSDVVRQRSPHFQLCNCNLKALHYCCLHKGPGQWLSKAGMVVCLSESYTNQVMQTIPCWKLNWIFLPFSNCPHDTEETDCVFAFKGLCTDFTHPNHFSSHGQYYTTCENV